MIVPKMYFPKKNNIRGWMLDIMIILPKNRRGEPKPCSCSFDPARESYIREG